MTVSSYHPDALDRRDPRYIEALLPAFEFLSARYFRLQLEGAENVPSEPAVFVANHNGGILGPDLFCTLSTLWRLRDPVSPLYALAHDFAMRTLTPLGRVLQKVGAIAACRANAARVLERGGQLLVYPGGDLDAFRTTWRRDRIVILPRTGFIQVARDAGVPIVPVVAHGAHRSAYIFSDGERIAELLQLRRLLRIERFPLALALPWGIAPGPLPYLPLPFPIKLRFLPPMRIPPEEDARAAAGRVQSLMQATLDELAR